MSKKLLKMHAIITGAARGIGEETSRLFVNQGVNLLMVDIDKKVIQVAKELNAHCLQLDISEENSWKVIKTYIKENFSNLDILVNNAGITGLQIGDQTPENMSISTWNKVQKINMQSVYLGCKYAIKIMKNNPNNCSIVNVASRSGLVGLQKLAAYASSKASIINYTKSVALYCAENNYNIRCNSVAPAAILTKMWDHLIKTQKDIEEFSKTIPLQRMGMPQDVANAILYLASNDSTFTNGSNIIIDGGILAGSTASPKS